MADTESSSPEATKGPWSSKENRRVAAASAAVDTFARSSFTEGGVPEATDWTGAPAVKTSAWM